MAKAGTIDREGGAWSERAIVFAGDIAVYSTAVIGYFFSLVTARRLDVNNFLAYTAIIALYVIAAWYTFRVYREPERPRVPLFVGAGAVSLLAFTSGMMHMAGIGFNWLLYFATVGMLVVVLPLRVGAVAAVLLYLLVGLNSVLIGHEDDMGDWLSILAGFFFVVAFSYSNRLLTSERERSRRLLMELEATNSELNSAHTQLQAYANEVEELAVARERTRMAREIHDTLGHYLTILSIQLETIAKLQERDPAKAAVEVAEARRVAAQSMQEVRNAVAALRPSSIATLSLKDSLRQLGDEFRRVAEGTELTLDLEGDIPPLAPDVQLALYRAAQEALTNVRKHAEATRVLLRLTWEGDEVELVVVDNGKGAQEPRDGQEGRGFGLIGLGERMELLGCQVSHGPVGEKGYRVEVRVPAAVIGAPLPVGDASVG
jgi:signal transduction histidine kinase